MKEWVKEKNIKEKSLVYCYEFIDEKSVYVGRCLQHRLNKRHNEHRRGLFKNMIRTGDSLFNYINENNIDLPLPKILEKDLDLLSSCDKEGYYVNQYKKDGWTIINKAKCSKKSSSVGSLSHGKWDYNTCYKEALRYKTKKEFRVNNKTVYAKSIRNKWIDDYYWLLDKNKEKEWKYEDCKRLAMKYKFNKDFRSYERKAYESARRHGWLKKFTWLKQKKKESYYTFEKCEEIAKTCKNRYDFQKANKSAYDRAWREGWLETWFGKERSKIGFYDIYENVYNVATKYEYVADFRNENETVYQKARKHGWLKKFTWLKRKSSNQYIKNIKIY